MNKKNSDYHARKYVEIEHPEWSRNAVIYEVNIRQYTVEGTFAAFRKHLPRLKELGIDILWLMPVHPIGEENRKGELGSYYSVKDYYGINPEFGDSEDFKELIREIHRLDMYVIIDWVANHSAWDNPLRFEHPEWYIRDKAGNFCPTPWYDWDDIIDFDYSVPALRKYMTEAMKYYLREFDIDGFRCDVAGFVPIDFWENVRKELSKLKEIFLLAEWESRDLHKNAFNMSYSWSFYSALREAASGKGLAALYEYMAHDRKTFPPDAYRMLFTDNHDINSWQGSQFEQFGDALPAAIAMTAVAKGMMLIYSGQESGLDVRLKFFEKDLIEHKQHKLNNLFKVLTDLKHRNKALKNGNAGGDMLRITNDFPDRVLSFYREKEADAVLSAVNFSKSETFVNLDTAYFKGSFKNIFTGEYIKTEEKTKLKLPAWGFCILEKLC